MGRPTKRGDEIVTIVHLAASDCDPAGFGPPKGRSGSVANFTDGYETASRAAAEALVSGAKAKTALEVFLQEMARLHPDRELSKSAMRELRWHLERRWVKHAVALVQG